MQKNKIKIITTGGHAATPALAVIQEIKNRNWESQIYWIGPRSAMEGKNVTTAAEKIMGTYGVKIIKIIAGRAKKRGSLSSIILSYIKIPFGFFHAFLQVLVIRPSIVISFGGFASVPVVVSAWFLGIPIIIHEQIVGAGLANKLATPFANKILLARSESLEFFPSKKSRLIGNPQVSTIFEVKPKKKIGSPPTIFVTGGSSGAAVINKVIESGLETLLQEFIVIHQAGENDIDRLLEKKRLLPSQLGQRYGVFSYVSPDRIVEYYQRADIVVSRAGANTVSDIVNTRRPAILIPIPWSIGDEQQKNAEKAQKCGAAIILPQQELTPESLLIRIKDLQKRWGVIVNNIKPGDYELDKNAAKSFVDVIQDFLK